MIMVAPTQDDLRFVNHQENKRKELEFKDKDIKALEKLGIPIGDIKKELDKMVGEFS